MDFRVIIPARYASTRLPGKVLMEVAGKSMLQHVYERALESDPESVVIAVDDERVAEVARGFGAQVCMTSTTHQCGTERLSEVVDALSYDDDDIVLGLQADEPMISPEVIRQLAADLETHERVKVASLYEPITTVDDLFDPHVVKVVLSRRQFALYFSRAPIPWGRDTFDDKSDLSLEGQYFRHIGLYGYRSGFLREYIEWPQSPLETVECLEQLRILWNGGRLHMSQACRAVPKGIDTQADFDALVKLLNKSKKSSTV